MMAEPLAKERLAADWHQQVHTAVARTAMVARSSDGQLAQSFADDIAEGARRGTALSREVKALVSGEEETALYASVMALRARYLEGGVAYGEVKEELVELLDAAFGPARVAYRALMADPAELERLLAAGAERARLLALVAQVHDSTWATDLQSRAVDEALAELGRPLPSNPFVLVASTLGQVLAGVLIMLTRIGHGTVAEPKRRS